MHFVNLLLRLLKHFRHGLGNLRVECFADLELVLLLVFEPRLLLVQFFDLRLKERLESLLLIFLQGCHFFKYLERSVVRPKPMIDVLQLLHQGVDNLGLTFQKASLRSPFFKVHGSLGGLTDRRLRIRCLLNAPNRRRQIHSLALKIVGGPAFQANIMLQIRNTYLRMRAIVVQFVVLVDNILNFHLAVFDRHAILNMLLFGVVVLEPLLVIVDRVFFDRRGARPIRLHVLLKQTRIEMST